MTVVTDQNLGLAAKFPSVSGALYPAVARTDKHIKDRLSLATALYNLAGASHAADVLTALVPLLLEALRFDVVGTLATVIAGHARATELRTQVFAGRSARGAPRCPWLRDRWF